MSDAELLAHLRGLEIVLMRNAGAESATQAEALLHLLAEEAGAATERSSIWQRDEGGAWRLRFHQGTPA